MRAREKTAMRALFRAETAALKGLRAATKNATDHLVLQAAHDEQLAPAARARNAKRQLQWVLPHLATKLAAAVLLGRRGAREHGRADLESQVHPDAMHARDETSDAPRAYAGAAGLVAAWSAQTLATVAKWSAAQRKNARLLDEGETRAPKTQSLTAALLVQASAFEPRLARTAATEAAHAFNEARAEVMAAHVGLLEPGEDIPYPGDDIPYPGDDEGGGGGDDGGDGGGAGGGESDALARRGPDLDEDDMRAVKVWSALSDACPDCKARYGEIVAADEEFPGGDPPAHPFCRCIPVFLEMAASQIAAMSQELAA